MRKYACLRWSGYDGSFSGVEFVLDETHLEEVRQEYIDNATPGHKDSLNRYWPHDTFTIEEVKDYSQS